MVYIYGIIYIYIWHIYIHIYIYGADRRMAPDITGPVEAALAAGFLGVLGQQLVHGLLLLGGLGGLGGLGVLGGLPGLLPQAEWREVLLLDQLWVVTLVAWPQRSVLAQAASAWLPAGLEALAAQELHEVVVELLGGY